MKRSVLLFILLVVFAPADSKHAGAQQARVKPTTDPKETGESTMLYGDGGAFLVTAPNEWVIDREVGKQMGVCCVFYPRGSTWDSADAVMYPNLVTKGPRQETLEQFMKADIERFREHDPGLSFKDSKDILLKGGKKALVRNFLGVNKGSSEVVAYIDESKIIAVFVLSTKSPEALNNSLPLFRECVGSYLYMDVEKKVPRAR